MILTTILKIIRVIILKKTIWRQYKFGKNAHIGPRVKFWAKKEINIGDNFYIGRDSQIECNCIIGSNVIIANKVGLVGRYDHHFQQIGVPIRLASSIRDNDYQWKGLTDTLIIEDDVWIGYGAIILSGLRIGTGTIIAAGSVLTKDADPYSIYAGNPASKIRNRFESEEDLCKHLEILNK